MGAVRFIYDETTRELKRLGACAELGVKRRREISQGKLRYCLQNDTLYLPADISIVDAGHRLCWGRARIEEFDEHPWLDLYDTPLDVDPLDFHMPFTGIGFGLKYSRRHMETENGRVPVKSFICQSIIDTIAKNPDALEDLGKDEFEALAAELSARLEFDIDLYRGSKDDGIDFLIASAEPDVTSIYCVQCKHPDKAKPGKKRRPLPVSTVREIYGVAKAFNLDGCIAITSSHYTPAAKEFAELKREEILVADAEGLINWVRQYRWCPDE